MKREILFRGLRIDGSGWVCGWLVKTSLMTYIVVNSNDEYKEILDYIEVIPESVGQFTGLTDKNGTKIFEGDYFVRYGNFKSIIEWNKSRSKYDFKYEVNLMSPQWMGGVDSDFALREIEIIGNIHEEVL